MVNYANKYLLINNEYYVYCSKFYFTSKDNYTILGPAVIMTNEPEIQSCFRYMIDITEQAFPPVIEEVTKADFVMALESVVTQVSNEI